MKKDDIEDLFKKSFEEYEAEVNPSIWKNIKIGLKWGGLALFLNTLLNKIGTNAIIAILTTVAVLISTAVIVNKSNNDKAQSSNENNLIPTTTTTEKSALIDSNDKTQLNNAEQREENRKIHSDDHVKESGDIPKTLPTNTPADSQLKNEKTGDAINEEIVASISANHISGTAPLIVDLANYGTGKTNNWTYSDGKKGSTTSNQVHIFENPGVYSVILASVNAEGKKAIDSIKVSVNPSVSSTPIGLTPNGDRINDILTLNLKNIAFMSLKVFDTNGTLVYKSDRIDAQWDGKDLKGKEAKEGIYFYTISAEDLNGKKYEPKGSINLTR